MLFVVGLAIPARAQAVPDTSHSPVDRWLGVPVHIKLDEVERKKVDSLRISFAKESAMGDASAKTPEARMAAVSKTHERILRFQALVRDVLTAEQQSVFDRNLATAPRAAPRP
jgi:hypothetical protein